MDKDNRPEHIGLILDGNSRWAKRFGKPASYGHRMGAKNLIKIIRHAKDLGIKYLTVYVFSKENWKRPLQEVNFLKKLLKLYLKTQAQNLIKNKIKLKILGNLDGLPEEIVSSIRDLEKQTQDFSDFYLNVCFGYSGRQEIIDATKTIAQNVIEKRLNLDTLTEDIFKQYTYNPHVPYPDLIVRTGGNMRISNFLLWQIAYAELYFTDVYWPAFSTGDLDKAIDSFKNRKRTYGERKN